MLFIAIAANAQNEAAELVKQGLQKSNMGNHDEALTLYSKALETDPELLDAYVKRAYVNSILKNYDATIEDYNKILSIKPDLVIVYVSRGSAFSKLKQYDKAIADFDHALSLDKNNSEAYNNRGWAKKYQGDSDGVCEDWKTSKNLGNEEAKIILKNNKC